MPKKKSKKAKKTPSLSPRERWAKMVAERRDFMLLIEPNRWTVFSLVNGQQLIVYNPIQRRWNVGRQKGTADFEPVLRMAKDIEKQQTAKPGGY